MNVYNHIHVAAHTQHSQLTQPASGPHVGCVGCVGCKGCDMYMYVCMYIFMNM